MTQGDTPTVLSIDIGGTKTLVSLVRGNQILTQTVKATGAGHGPDHWVEQAAALATGLCANPEIEQPTCVAAAVTGRVNNGRWSALNQATLDLPKGYPLTDKLTACLNLPAFAINDAQAAAWGEYRYGAGQGRDMVFLTVSTGIGGGIVIDGRLLTGRGGLAGHFGITWRTEQGYLEDRVSGGWIAAEAARQGHSGADARAVFASAAKNAAWAAAIVTQSAERLAALLHDIQLTLDPGSIVLGGGIGLAPGYLAQVRQILDAAPEHAQPDLRPAALGTGAGILGAAALAADALYQKPTGGD